MWYFITGFKGAELGLQSIPTQGFVLSTFHFFHKLKRASNWGIATLAQMKQEFFKNWGKKMSFHSHQH